MEELTKEKALELANQYLKEHMHLKLSFTEPPSGFIYSGLPKEDCYFFLVSGLRPHVGESRIIAVSKATGKVMFDQYVGE